MIRLTVYRFSVGDVEDPEIYAAAPILTWQNSEPGKWIMEHAIDKPMYRQYIDHNTYGYQYSITADLTDEDAMIFKLKWPEYQ